MCLLLPPLHAQPAAPANWPVDVVRDVLQSLWAYDHAGRPAASRRVGFELPETVVNLYLAATLPGKPRPMIDEMRLTMLPGDRCVVDAKVDFDALQKAAPKLFSASERQQFKGLKSVRAEFHFSVSSGFLSFEATPLPSEVTPSQRLLPEVIRQIAASQPEKIDTQRRIPLPFGLRRLWTREGVLCGET
jgi:hypothetical protein